MEALVQPNGSLCGQTCVAMVAGCSVDEAVAACGSVTNGSYDNELRAGLTRLGIKAGRAVVACRVHNKRKRKLRAIPNFCIATINDNKTDWSHVVVVRDSFVYDPAIGYPLPMRVFEDFIMLGRYGRFFVARGNQHKDVKAAWKSFIPILSTQPEVPGPHDVDRVG